MIIIEQFIELLKYNEWKVILNNCNVYEKTNFLIGIEIDYNDCYSIHFYKNVEYITDCFLDDVLDYINNTPELSDFKLEPLPNE